MKNLVKIDLGHKMKAITGTLRIDRVPHVNTVQFLEVVGQNDEERLDALRRYLSKFQIFALDLETLELTAGYTKDNKSYVNEDYFRKYSENDFVDLSDNMLYMEYDYICTWGENKIWGKLKKELGDGHTINWELYPLWGSRKARIVDLLLNDE